MIHETGHNAGLNHDFFVHNPSVTTATPYGHGFVSFPSRARTVMAYRDLCNLAFGEDENCLHIPRFSDPAATFGGWPLGVPPGSFYNEVNAVAAMTEALWMVANYRPSLLQP